MIHNPEDARYNFCHRLQKCELHAHLNGSIRIQTLNELIQKANYSDAEVQRVQILNDDDRSLDECFRIFDMIYKVVRTPETIRRIMRETLEDFEEDNVVYVEIRTTPRRDVMSADEYVRAAVEGIIEYEHNANKVRIGNTSCNPTTKARLLLSINRTSTLEDAFGTVEVANKYFYKDKNEGENNKYNRVVGVELSGNPAKGQFKTFLPALERAKSYGIPISIHTGEVFNPDEVFDILEFCPDRLGHALYLGQDNINRLLSMKNPIPIEICPTSNTRNLQLNDLSEHPTLQTWLLKQYPISLNTDDSVLFSTTLTNEYYKVAKTFNLSDQDLERLCLNVWDQIFDSHVKTTRVDGKKKSQKMCLKCKL